MGNNQPTQKETWKPIPGWENLYEVSDQGRVRSLDRIYVRASGQTVHNKGKVLSPAKYHCGHLHVNLRAAPRKEKWRVHKLVLMAFVGPCPEGMEVCHNNGNPADNRLENLRYDTHSANLLDRNEHGTCHYRKRTHCPRGHKLEAPNLMRSLYGKNRRRACLACNRASAVISRIPEFEKYRQEIADQKYAEILAGITRGKPFVAQ